MLNSEIGLYVCQLLYHQPLLCVRQHLAWGHFLKSGWRHGTAVGLSVRRPLRNPWGPLSAWMNSTNPGLHIQTLPPNPGVEGSVTGVHCNGPAGFDAVGLRLLTSPQPTSVLLLDRTFTTRVLREGPQTTGSSTLSLWF